MKKQEEIQKGTEVALCGGMLLGTELYEEEGYYFLTAEMRGLLAKRILSYLKSAGVVIKVDENLVPDCSDCGGTGEVTYDTTSPSGIFLYETHHTCTSCSGTGKNQDGYVAVEPIIEEK